MVNYRNKNLNLSRTLASAAAIGGTLVVLTMHSALAQTAEVDADFSKFCRQNFTNSAYQKRQQPWGVEHYCYQGATPQGIDLAQACTLTTGNPRFRKFGGRVLCASNSQQPQSSSQTNIADLVRYCATKFPNSVYEKRAQSTGAEHYCRRPGASGGFTLQNIDLSDVCSSQGGIGSYIKSVGNVLCVGTPQSTQNNPPVAQRKATAAKGGIATHPAKTENSTLSKSSDHLGNDPASLEGFWMMTVNSIRQGMKVRLSIKGDRVIGTIVSIPGKLAQAVRNMDGLTIGQPFLYGSLSGKILTGTTRIGLAAASQIMNAPGNIMCKGFVANIEKNPRKWMPYTLKREGNTLKGHHRFVGVTYGSRGCATITVPDNPPRFLGGKAIFEMVKQ